MQKLDRLVLWLADHADLALPALHEGWCRLLAADGLPISRSVLGTETLHPEVTGGQSIWTLQSLTTDVYYHGVEVTSSYLDSPLRVVDDTGEPYRRRLTGTIADMPLLEELRQAGWTDYFIVPLPFLDRTRSASLSFATAAREGFSDAEMAHLSLTTRIFSPYAERRVLRRIAVDLLDTYVGHHAGERIFSGQIRRGAVETIGAAILMCDLRGFTVLSKAEEQPVVIETLNAWFDAVAGAVDAQGGEILKFMGDGLLAVFRVEADAAEACRRAFAAAEAAQSAIAALNAERGGAGRGPIAFVMGLHVGDVAYGNVGGRRRLDFTVLGPAVNYASRLQDLAKRLDRGVLVSRDFAACLSEPLTALGSHALRGIGRAEPVFALEATTPSTEPTARR